MIPILLVDDDIILLNKVNTLLERFSEQCMVIDRVMSGADALDAVHKYQPKIIFMDVELPIMNGIEATSRIMKEYPETYIIALSNYDNFFYLREMLQVGARDYILKHELSTDVMFDKIDGILKRCVELEDTANEVGGDSKVPWEQQDYFRYALFNRDEIYENMHSDNRVYGFMLFQITNFAIYYSKEKRENLLKSILTIIYNILPNESIAIETEHGEYAVLIHLKEHPSTIVLQKKLKEYVELIRFNLSKLLNISIVEHSVILHGNNYSLAKVYEEAERKIGLFVINNNDDKENNILQIQCLNHMINQEEKQFFEKFQIIFDRGKEKQISLSVVHRNVAELLKLIRSYLKSKNEYMDIEEEYSMNVEQLFQSQSVEECEEVFCKIISKLFYEMYIQGQLQYSEHILSAIEYIENHYEEDISLNAVAEHIGITSVYLSNLFKKEVGINFNHYLTVHRLKKSKKYIMNTKLSIKEIAKLVGYNNSSYFVSVFKQEYGCSPMKFRNQDQAIDR